MNNTVYGKTMQNLRKGVDVRLVNNKKSYLKWTPKLTYVAGKIFDTNLVTIHKIINT